MKLICLRVSNLFALELFNYNFSYQLGNFLDSMDFSKIWKLGRALYVEVLQHRFVRKRIATESADSAKLHTHTLSLFYGVDKLSSIFTTSNRSSVCTHFKFKTVCVNKKFSARPRWFMERDDYNIKYAFSEFIQRKDPIVWWN